MLQAMRNGAKSPIMKIFLLFLAGGFALWGIGDGSTGLIGGSDKAISAGKQSFSPREVALEFDRTRRTYLPNSTTAEAVQGGLLNEVVGTMSRELLFRAENEHLGLTVTRSMQRNTIADEKNFQDEFGMFSEGRFMQVLAGAGYTEQGYLDRVNNVLRREQLINPISKGLRFDKDLASVVAAFELEKRKVELTSFNVAPEAIKTPDSQAIKNFFDANKSSYDLPPLRSARIGSLSASSIAKEITITDDEIKATFDNRFDEFSKPETRGIRQMIFDDQASAIKALTRLNKGEDFTLVADSMLNWTNADTDLGQVTKTSIDGALVEPVFAADVGTIVGPLKTAFGFHLLLVDSITDAGVTRLQDVREQIASALRDERAISLLYDRVNMLEDAISGGATIEEAIIAVGGNFDIVNKIDRLGQTGDGEVPTDRASKILQDSAILDLIWESEINEASVIQEGSDDTFFVINVTEETQQRGRSIEEVKPRVIADYKRTEAIKNARLAAQKAAKIPENNNNTLTSQAFRRNGIGLDHEAAGLIAKVAFDQKIKDVEVIETGQEAIVVRTVEIIKASKDELKNTTELVMTVMNSALRDHMTNLMLLSLSQKHDLELKLTAVQQLLLGSEQ